MSEFVIELVDVVKRFATPEGNEVTAVDHVSLQIRHGEFFSLLGPSGCGKTTSLRMIAGFEWPTSGEVLIDGKPMGRTPPFWRPVNTVFQSYALFQHMTVFQNVAFGLEMDKTPASEIKHRVGEALEMVKLSGMERRKPRQLSGGQQQRVALARALVKRPKVLLLDEPLGALDLKLRREMQIELKTLQEQVGITFIYVTHDQEEALTMSDRITVMNRGKALQTGSPVEIYERPNCRFVADFIGQANFFAGKMLAFDDQGARVAIPALQTELIGQPVGNLEPGQAVAVSIRPEKVRIAQEPAFGSNSVRGRVIHTTYIGSNTHVLLELAGGVRINAWEQNKISTLDPKAYFLPGQEIWANLFPENVLILPED
jgi:spermidine/putrescine transport system ATP-binding protein